MQFHLIVVLVYLTNVGERSRRQLCPIAKKKDLISMYQGTLVNCFVNILVYFNKLATNFKPNNRFFKRIQIFLIIQTENKSATSSFSDPLLNSQLEITHSQLVQCSTVTKNKKLQICKLLITCQATSQKISQTVNQLVSL